MPQPGSSRSLNATMKHFSRSLTGILCFLGFQLVASDLPAQCIRRFDVATFCCPCSIQNHLCEPQFDHLNWAASPGHYLAMGGDAHRLAVTNQNNQLAAYYNNFSRGWAHMTATNKAALIDKYVEDRFTAPGLKPNWILLNEISGRQWPTNETYRKWAIDVVRVLHSQYGFQPILCAPFAMPRRNDVSWRGVAANAFIGIECYLSGEKIKQHEFSIEWCRQRYADARRTYEKRGVPADRLFLVEHFGQTPAGVNWGRGGVSADDWDRAIRVRSEAAHQVGFTGFVSYAWAKNRMKVSDAELLRFEDVYRAQILP